MLDNVENRQIEWKLKLLEKLIQQRDDLFFCNRCTICKRLYYTLKEDQNSNTCSTMCEKTLKKQKLDLKNKIFTNQKVLSALKHRKTVKEKLNFLDKTIMSEKLILFKEYNDTNKQLSEALKEGQIPLSHLTISLLPEFKKIPISEISHKNVMDYPK